MSTAQIRQRLHQIIDTVEDNKLKAIFTLLEGQLENYELTLDQKRELDRRLSDHKNGIGRTYTWNETVAMAEQALADRQNN